MYRPAAYAAPNAVLTLYNLSFVVRNQSSGFPNRSDTNQAVDPQKMAGGLKFRI